MSRRRKYRSPLFDRFATLAIIGLLAGVLGGVGIGIISGKTSSSSAASATH